MKHSTISGRLWVLLGRQIICGALAWNMLAISFGWAQSQRRSGERRRQPSWTATEFLPGIEWPEPPIVTPGLGNSCPPSDAIILFDGKDLSAWENGENWKVENCVATVGSGEIRTKQSFGDCQLHIEWSAPVPATGESQGRGNSGIYFMGLYEVQVLDSYENKTYPDGQAGAVYKQMPPYVNAMRPPGEWNYYDIAFTAPRFKEDGSLESPAAVTVFHNGVLVQNHFEPTGGTTWYHRARYEPHEAKLPLMLQDHGNPVHFRNIWLREIKPIVGTQVAEPKYHNHATGQEWLETEGDERHPPVE